MIKYHNAKDDNEIIISIDTAIKGKHYRCINCGKDMIPKLGKIREHHFSHKKESGISTGSLCSSETYIHEYAKHYLKRLFDTNSTLMISFNQDNGCSQISSCIYYKKVLLNSNNDQPSRCKKSISAKYDLKEFYDTCEIEKEYKGYVADLLLTSKAHPERAPLFIEIAVSHKCEQKKKNSGIRIIEIILPKDTDKLEGISIVEGEQKIPSSEHPIIINFYNFRPKQEKGETLDLYDFNVYYYDIYNEDHSRTFENKCSCFGRESMIKNALCEIHYPVDANKYNKWRQVHNKNLSSTKTCWICQHHDYNTRSHEHICSKGRLIEQPTLAIHCLDYQLDESKAENVKKKSAKMFLRCILEPNKYEPFKKPKIQ